MKKTLLTLALIAATQLTGFAANQMNLERTDSLHIWLLRGLTRESGYWDATFLAEMESSFPNAQLHFLDLPGSGEFHDVKCPVSIPGMVDFVRSAHAATLNASSGSNVIVATSLGSMVVTEWVNQYPNDFEGMILICPSYKGICKLKERAQMKSWGKMLGIALTFNRRKKEAKLLAINSNDTTGMSETLDEWVEIAEERPMSTGNILRQTFAGMLYKPSDLPEDFPTLIVASRMDPLVHCDCINKVHDELGGTLVWHDSSGHGIPIDAPAWLVAQISDWFDADIQPHYKDWVTSRSTILAVTGVR